MFTPPSVLKNIKIVEIEPSLNTNIQTNTETLVNTQNIVHDTNIEDNCPPDTNVQVEDTIPREELTVTQTVASGKATGTSEEVIKDKSSEKIGESDRVLVGSPSLLIIDASLV